MMYFRAVNRFSELAISIDGCRRRYLSRIVLVSLYVGCRMLSTT